MSISLRASFLLLALVGVGAGVWLASGEKPSQGAEAPTGHRAPLRPPESSLRGPAPRALLPPEAPTPVLAAPQRATAPPPDARVPSAPLTLSLEAPLGFKAPVEALAATLAASTSRHRLLARAAARWSQVGLCDAEEAAKRAEARSELLAHFTRLDSPVDSSTLLFDPEVRPEVIAEVQRSLGVAREAVLARIDWTSAAPPPLTIIYRSLSQLRAVSCVNTSAFGYYDGALHLSGNLSNGLLEVRRTVLHEYLHHALVTSGVRLPMWLGEGLAMAVAEEDWWRVPSLGLTAWLASTHLPFDELVPAFPHTADERYATSAYFQSLMMVEFLSARGGPSAVRTLVRELAKGALEPDEAFAVTAGLEGKELERAWQAWVAQALSGLR